MSKSMAELLGPRSSTAEAARQDRPRAPRGDGGGRRGFCGGRCRGRSQRHRAKAVHAPAGGQCIGA